MSDSEDEYMPRDGRDGKNGKDGRDGKDGRNGQQGKPGNNGLDGEDGVDGVDGKDGATGPTGPPGPAGNGNGNGNGSTGPTGCDGKQGLKGEKGDCGQQGEKGDCGQQGEKGDCGQKGEKGDCGQQGEKGDCGQKGEKGEKGEKGDYQGGKTEIAYVFATSQSVSDGDYIGVGSSDSRFIKNTIIMPKKCTATSLAFSIRQAASAEQYTALLNVNGVDSTFSAVLDGSVSPYSVLSFGTIELNPLDLISIHFRTNGDSASRGACVTLLTEA